MPQVPATRGLAGGEVVSRQNEMNTNETKARRGRTKRAETGQDGMTGRVVERGRRRGSEQRREVEQSRANTVQRPVRHYYVSVLCGVSRAGRSCH